MTDHDAQPHREVVLPDEGAWISGPCLGPAPDGYRCDACQAGVHCFDATRCACCGRDDDDDDVELCPQAKVPCEPNAFDLCKTCGRDLSADVS